MSSTTLPPLPAVSDSAELPPAARRSLVAGVLAAHVALAWGLLQVPEVRDAVSQVAPLMVDLVAPPAPPSPPSPPPPPKVMKPPPPAPLITSAPTPVPAPPAFVAPPPPVEPAPAAVEAPAAPPSPAAPPPPRTIPATAVQYLDPPAPIYPALSRRLGESGQVLVRVEIDPTGRASHTQLLRSSGHRRLDESALAAVRAARFKPYTENGVPLAVWSTVPIVFELEN